MDPLVWLMTSCPVPLSVTLVEAVIRSDLRLPETHSVDKPLLFPLIATSQIDPHQ
jgi:hypothetical protein